MLDRTCVVGLWLALTGVAAAQANQSFTLGPRGDGIPGSFGSSLARQGNTLLVGVPRQEVGGLMRGAVHVLEQAGDGAWPQRQVLVSPDPLDRDNFGRAIAFDGDLAVVGAPSQAGETQEPGRAFVFERDDDGVWHLDQELIAGDVAPRDSFGFSVSISGERITVSSPYEEATGVGNRGAVYVFERDEAGDWHEEVKLLSGDPSGTQYFGWSQEVEGDRVLAGSWTEDGEESNEGAAYVFDRQSDGSWPLTAKLKSSTTGRDFYFGQQLDLEGDRALIAARGENFGPPHYDAGAAYVFERDEDGTWIEAARLALADPPLAAGLGRSVSLRGGRALVGNGQNLEFPTDPARATLFERQADGTWLETLTLGSTNGASFYDSFAGSLSLEDDLAFVGSPNGLIGENGRGFVDAFAMGTLFRGAPQVPVHAGGAQELFLRAGEEHGGAVFMILGSASGTSPGTRISGLSAPLNPDEYFRLLTRQAGAGLLRPFTDTLDDAGSADAIFELPPAAGHALVGVTLHHAYVLLDSGSSFGIRFASNAVSCKLVP